MSDFTDDIRGQAGSLRELARHADELADTVAALELPAFERVVLGGMGGSHFAAYPAWLGLVARGMPAFWVDAAELLQHARPLVDARTLLWLTSQSGESVEVVELLRGLPDEGRPTVVGLTNSPSSTLARSADVVLDLHAGPEHAVSTRTYVNTLAVFALAVESPRVEPVVSELTVAADALDAFLDSLADSTAQARTLLAGTERLLVLGRGPSLAAARAGALTIKEAAKTHAEALGGGEFRHGPIELAGPSLTAVILAGDERSARLNAALASELVAAGSRVLWVGADAPPGARPLATPPATGPLSRSISEIVALQICSLALAELRGVEPGVFTFAAKVTTVL